MMHGYLGRGAVLVVIINHLVYETVLILTLQGSSHVLCLTCKVFRARLRQLLHLLLWISESRLIVFNQALEKVLVQAVPRRSSFVEEWCLRGNETWLRFTANFTVLATILGALVNLPSFIITPLVVITATPFHLYGIRQTAIIVLDQAGGTRATETT